MWELLEEKVQVLLQCNNSRLTALRY